MKKDSRDESGKRPKRVGRMGFTLLEALVTLLLVAGLAATLLHGLATALQAHTRSRQRWSATIDLWNRACLARIRRSEEGGEFRPMPQSRPIRRIVIEGAGAAKSVKWEVLRAEK